MAFPPTVPDAYATTNANTDGVVAKYNAAGDQLWSRQFGTSDYDNDFAVSPDELGNVFIVGGSARTSHHHVFLTKYDSDGNQYWFRELVSARYVVADGIAADGLGNVYISGRSNAPIEVPRDYLGYDAFLAKYDANGNRVWIREFGTTNGDNASGVAVDGLGSVYVTGNTGGSLGGINVGGEDAFLAKFDVDGNQLWVHQFGTPADDSANYLAADGFGDLYIAGSTGGDLGGPNSGGGGRDVFLAKFTDPVPEPHSFLLFLAGIPCFRRLRERRFRDA
jgi:hypothetical protein